MDSGGKDVVNGQDRGHSCPILEDTGPPRNERK